MVEDGAEIAARIVAVAHDVTCDALGAARGIEALEAVWDALTEAAGQLDERHRVERPPDRPIQCKAGCGHCCHQRSIDVTAIEVLHLVHWLENHVPAERRQAVITRWEADPGTCPLLVDEACSVHPARPMICRAMNSYDVAACIRRYDVPVYGPSWTIYRHFQAGLMTGLAALGYSDRKLSLGRSIAIALGTPDVIGRWLAGEAVLAEGEVIPEDLA
ncbi:MAG: YkgJ family cysteine cluster protein [Rhodospirillales bacterium]|nr:YkgJ family cysteine cluster protein [Rhodospirillales bacterium]